jgi:hypothetical protein
MRVLGVILLLGRTSAARDEIRVHRDHDVPRVDQALDEQAVAGLDHDPDLGGVRLNSRSGDQRRHPRPALCSTRTASAPCPGGRHRWNSSAQSIPTTSRHLPLMTVRTG